MIIRAEAAKELSAKGLVESDNQVLAGMNYTLTLIGEKILSAAHTGALSIFLQLNEEMMNHHQILSRYLLSLGYTTHISYGITAESNLLYISWA